MKLEEKEIFDKKNLMYWVEIKKFINSEVVVETFENDKIIETKGRLMAINFNYSNIILMTDTEKLFIKQWFRIRRKRKSEAVTSKLADEVGK